MKKAGFAALLIAGWIGCLHGQGTVNFANISVGVDAPVSDPAGNRLTGPEFAAQLFFAPVGSGTNIDSFTPLNSVTPFESGLGAGYFLGGLATIPGFASRSPISLIVAAFSTAQGSTYRASRGNGGTVGNSPLILVVLGVDIFPPPNLVGMQSFTVVPEPPATTLLVIAIVGGLVGARRLRRLRVA